jgi:integrase
MSWWEGMVGTKMLKQHEVMKLPDGTHCDGDYLLLRVKGRSRSWIVRGPRRPDGKRLDRGLGSANTVSLAAARKNRDALLEDWRAGRDPAAEKRKAREAQAKRKTFAEVAEEVIEKKSSGWKYSLEEQCSTLAQWRRNLTAACKPIARMFVDEITIDELEGVLQPYWDRGHHKAGRDLLRRIEAVINYAIAKKWRTNANPATWKVFQQVWPGVRNSVVNHAALPWRDCPEFFLRLEQSDATSARLLEFIMLTAARSTEARGAKWSEINFETRVWTIPAVRMKASRMKKIPEPHDVPLSDQAIALLRRMEAEKTSDFVFVGGRGEGAKAQGKPIRNASLWGQLRRLTNEATTHGFRASFRTWCGDTGVDYELAERCLAHTFGDATANAYARSTLIERRRPIMEAWGAFVDGSRDNVVPFEKRAA